MKKRTLILLNLLIIIFELRALFLSVNEFGYRLFTYYTQYSNMLTLISSVLLIICIYKNKFPRWLRFLRYASTHVMCVTFVIVAFLLTPMLVYSIGGKGIMMLTHGSMVYHHTLCPLLVFISFVFFEEGCPICKYDYFCVLIPTCLYGVIMVCLNIFKTIDGPYPFLRVLYQPFYASIIWLVVLLVLTFFISLLIFKLSSKNLVINAKKRNRVC